MVTWGLVGLSAAALAFALLVGGREERAFAVAKAVAALGGVFARTGTPMEAVVRDATIDLVLLAVVVPLALRSSKVWPLAAASICLASLMTGAAQMLVHASLQAYGLVQGGWDLLAGLVLAAGAWHAWRARRGGGRAAESPTDPA
jgi:hypothetical protein